MRVAFFPNILTRLSNPYLDLLEKSLKTQGILFEEDGSDFLSWRRLLKSRHQVTLYHFHWIDYHYHGPTFLTSFLYALKFIVKLIFARSLGYRIVYTLHNLHPHETSYPLLDFIVRKAMLLSAHSVIVHCNAGRDLLEKEFGRKRNVHVIPLGNYIGVHKGRITRNQSRACLGISLSDKVFLCFGLIRPYKGIEQLLQSWKSLTLKNAQLWIVGQPQDPDYENKIRYLSEDLSQVNLHLEFIPDDEVALYFSAADVVVLPFSQVLTSSSAMLALSFGCPVVCPSIGCLPELVTPECGFLYDPDLSGSLEKTLALIMSTDLTLMRQNAYKQAKSFTWAETASLTIDAYNNNIKYNFHSHS